MEWNPKDRSKILAEHMERKLMCPGCGTRRDEWDPNQGGSRFAYDPVIEICPGCERKGLLLDDHDVSKHHGLYVVLKPPQ